MMSPKDIKLVCASAQLSQHRELLTNDKQVEGEDLQDSRSW